MTFVLDTSVTMSWCFADEASPATDALLRRLADEHAIVPTLWQLEVANVLVLARRRGRITESQASRFAALLGELPIDVDRSSTPMTELMDAAERHTLTAYDAAYLLLAARTGAPLATRDRSLKKAAKSAGVEVLV